MSEFKFFNEIKDMYANQNPDNLKINNGELSKQTEFLKTLVDKCKLTIIEQSSEKVFSSDVLVELTNENWRKLAEFVEEDYKYLLTAEKVALYYKTAGIKFENVDDKQTQKAYYHLLKLIDYENSTNMQKNPVDFDSIYNYILNSNNNFYVDLERGVKNLPDKLNQATEKNLLSYCSKVCKFLYQYLFDICDTKNPYFLYDKYVAHILRHYLYHYFPSIEKELRFIKKDNNKIVTDESGKKCYTEYELYSLNRDDNKSKIIKDSTLNNVITYESFHALMDELLNKINDNKNSELSRSQLDLIMWYCYKSYNIS